ncbi:hypothetical protein ATANTOWER_012848, partial [Ataeniobius toweri]|nr:hypothetical protein [Ataeniobius toweri]
VVRRLVPISSGHWARGQFNSGQVIWSSQDHVETHWTISMHTCSPKGTLERPIKLAGIFLHCGRKPGYPDRSYKCTGSVFPPKQFSFWNWFRSCAFQLWCFVEHRHAFPPIVGTKHDVGLCLL